MKIISVMVSLLLGLSSVALAGAIPHSSLETFDCQYGQSSQNPRCFTGNFYGQTLNNNPIKATVQASLDFYSRNETNGNVISVAHLQVTKLEDPTNVYFIDSNIAVRAVAKVCAYHRDCYYHEVSSNFVMNRTYGQRYFENGPAFDVLLFGNSGAEQTDMLTELDLWIPMQQYPIVVNF